MMKKIRRTTGLILTAWIFLCTAVSAATIEFWTTETQSDRIKTIQLLMDTFQALNPEVAVKLVPVDENDMPSQMAAASAAGALPALIEASSELMLAFGEEGILDVSSAGALVDKLGKKRFYQGALKMMETAGGGSYYALPYHGWVQGIWYRADWFKDAGLAPPDTWENILKAAKTFYKPQQNRYGILVGTKPEAYSEQCFTHFALSNGAGEFNASGELVFNSSKTLETLTYYAELAKFNPPGPQTWRARDYYIQGKLAMFFYSTYIMDDLALAEVAAGSLTDTHFPQLGKSTFDPELVDNTRVVATITKVKPAAYGAIVGLGLVKQKSEPHSDAARKLVEFLYEPASYITFLHMAPGGMNPMLRDIAGRSEYLNDPGGVFKRYGRSKIEEIISGLDHIGSFTIVAGRTFPAAGKIYAKQIIPRMIYSVTIEGMKPADALKWAEDQMQSVINE
jgi:multiple sugar transport system substrate-binding protein